MKEADRLALGQCCASPARLRVVSSLIWASNWADARRCPGHKRRQAGGEGSSSRPLPTVSQPENCRCYSKKWAQQVCLFVWCVSSFELATQSPSGAGKKLGLEQPLCLRAANLVLLRRQQRATFHRYRLMFPAFQSGQPPDRQREQRGEDERGRVCGLLAAELCKALPWASTSLLMMLFVAVALAAPASSRLAAESAARIIIHHLLCVHVAFELPAAGLLSLSVDPATSAAIHFCRGECRDAASLTTAGESCNQSKDV